MRHQWASLLKRIQAQFGRRDGPLPLPLEPMAALLLVLGGALDPAARAARRAAALVAAARTPRARAATCTRTRPLGATRPPRPRAWRGRARSPRSSRRRARAAAGDAADDGDGVLLQAGSGRRLAELLRGGAAQAHPR